MRINSREANFFAVTHAQICLFTHFFSLEAFAEAKKLVKMILTFLQRKIRKPIRIQNLLIARSNDRMIDSLKK